ncbi:hypothetical protein KSC_106400 [Ktedonobacter sp. SOSP1-52]|nr:hypothetical protein KSC_106400 [Ktedonobacter sp. SOSP1-52]
MHAATADAAGPLSYDGVRAGRLADRGSRSDPGAGDSKPFTANEVEQVAVHLAGLARQLPADLANRFGTPPSTDIPLRGPVLTTQKRE